MALSRHSEPERLRTPHSVGAGCRGNLVGEVMAFFANDEDSEVTAQIQQYTMTDDSQTWRVEGPVIFPLAADILATMLWAPFGRGVVRVILPAMP